MPPPLLGLWTPSRKSSPCQCVTRGRLDLNQYLNTVLIQLENLNQSRVLPSSSRACVAVRGCRGLGQPLHRLSYIELLFRDAGPGGERLEIIVAICLICQLSGPSHSV